MSVPDDIIREPEIEEPKEKPEKTKLQQFIERLSQYSDKETAKTHILEISQDLKCAKSLGYKALNKIDQFKPSKTEAVEPTAKIGETKPELLEEEESPPSEGVGEAEQEATLEEPSTPETATGFREQDLTWMFDKGFSGLAKLTGYGDFALEKADSQKLGEIWTPILNQYLPAWMPYAPIAIAAITTIAIVVPKVKGYWDYRKKTKEKTVEKPPEKPQEETKKEETKEETKPPLEPNTNAQDRPTTAPFLKKL
jgi:hypothetical protein